MIGFRAAIDIPVRFRDTDAMGHANNAVYLSYLEEARFAYMRTVFGITDWREIGIILARVEIDYRSPALCGETLTVGIRTSTVGGASFGSQYRLEEKVSRRLVAEAKSVQVAYDYRTGKVLRLSAAQASALRNFDAI